MKLMDPLSRKTHRGTENVCTFIMFRNPISNGQEAERREKIFTEGSLFGEAEN